MADSIAFGIDTGAIRAARDDAARRFLRAGTEAIRVTTRELEQDLEQLVRSAVPGGLWRALKSSVYPRSGIARNPAGEIYINGGARTQGAFSFFTTPGRVAGKDGFFLAIPLPAAGSRGRNRNLTPGEWERRTGIRLRFVYRPGRASLLVADEGVLNGRTGTFRPITRKRTQADERRGFLRGATTTPIFVLIPSVAHANRVALRPVIDAAGAKLSMNVRRRLGDD
ncbi:DUF6441 family protein [Sphingobium agri]|uniref:DUF6441 family protein n=1 Tax=Sphingobium agri TaxID=2933566 RepID=A0ABT0E212_9SPHN|nr:DUF6441 family protein [Sphingobium agri]MCK0533402.1 DUF6441 family protein [Sphingobium agri]